MNTYRSVLLVLIVSLVFGYGGCTKRGNTTIQAQPASSQTTALAELRTAIDTFYNAFYDKNWDVYYTFYADDAAFVDGTGQVMTLEEYETRAAKDAEVLGDLVKESVVDLIPEVRLSPSGQSGVAFSRHPYKYRNADGKETTIVIAETDVWWKIDGEWKVVHIHFPDVQQYLADAQ